MDWLTAVGIVGSLAISATSLGVSLSERQSRIRKERAKARALVVKIAARSVVGEQHRSEPGYTFGAVNNSIYPITVTAIAGVVDTTDGIRNFSNVQIGEIKMAPARPDLGLAPRPVQIWRGESPPFVLAPDQTHVASITQQVFADYYLKGPPYPTHVEFSMTYIAEGDLAYHFDSGWLPLDIPRD